MSETVQDRARVRDPNFVPAWKSPWVWGMALGVLVMVGANVVMITIGMNTHPGLVVSDFYDRGKNYFNAEQKRVDEASRLGWKLDFKLPEQPKYNVAQTYDMAVIGGDGYPLANAEVMLEAFRPSDESKDFSVPLIAKGNGTYGAEVVFPLPGNWDVIVTVKRNSDKQDLAKRVIVGK